MQPAAVETGANYLAQVIDNLPTNARVVIERLMDIRIEKALFCQEISAREELYVI